MFKKLDEDAIFDMIISKGRKIYKILEISVTDNIVTFKMENLVSKVKMDYSITLEFP